MKLNYKEASWIIKQFPYIEPSYERKTHKKVQSNIILTIPKGNKYFAWFRTYKNKNICFFLELDRYKKKIKYIYKKCCCFNSDLCSGKGTILYGTIFNYKTEFYNIENIYYFMNKDISQYNQDNKFKLLIKLCKNYIKQIAFSKNQIIFGLPIIETNRNRLLNKIKNLPYNLYAIQYRLLYKNTTLLNEIINHTVITNKDFLLIYYLLNYS